MNEWTPEKVTQLKKSVKANGKKWLAISKELGFSNNQCREKYLKLLVDEQPSIIEKIIEKRNKKTDWLTLTKELNEEFVLHKSEKFYQALFLDSTPGKKEQELKNKIKSEVNTLMNNNKKKKEIKEIVEKKYNVTISKHQLYVYNTKTTQEEEEEELPPPPPPPPLISDILNSSQDILKELTSDDFDLFNSFIDEKEVE